MASLSEDERRQLSELERQMEAEDPRFAASLSHDGSRRTSTRHILLGLLAFAAGGASLVISMVHMLAPLGIAGLLIMTAGVAWTVSLGMGAGDQARRSITDFIKGSRPR